jgi:tetratricopeptide (TPR) repeat protein
MAASNPVTPRQRLDSWKEIATFFGRDERTVKRWEKERALPVYRVPGSARGGVFAYADELTHWLQGTSPVSEDEPAAEISAAQNSPAVQIPALPENVIAIDRAVATPKPDRGRFLLWLVPLLAVGAVVLLFWSGHRRTVYNKVLAAPHVPSAGARDFYLKGRYHWDRRTPDDLNQAVDDFTQAIVHDPAYAAAYVGLADSYNLLREFSVMPSGEAFSRARAAAEKAVELDPNSAEAHTSLAFALFWGSADIGHAQLEFQRALELDPANARAHHWYATYLSEIGQNQQALDEIERARQLDPSSNAIEADKGSILANAGRADESVALLKQIEATEPGFLSAHRYLSRVYFERGDFPLSFEEGLITVHLLHDPKARVALASEEKAYAAGGRQDLLQERLENDRKLHDQGLISDFDLASDYAALDNKTEALRYLESSYEKHEAALSQLVGDWNLKPLHEEPAFKKIAGKLGFPQVTQTAKS